jgi:Bacterial Ig domain
MDDEDVLLGESKKWLSAMLSSVIFLYPVIPSHGTVQAEEHQNESQGQLMVTKYDNGEIWGEFQTTGKRERVIASLTTPNGTKKQVYTDYFNSSGIFKLDFNTQPNGTKVELLAVSADETSYRLIELDPFVLDKNVLKVPDAPVVYPVYLEAEQINGYAEAGSTITLMSNEEYIKTTMADANGYFSIPIDQHVLSDTLTIYAANAGGNGPVKQIIVQDEPAQNNFPIEVGSILEDNSTFTVKTVPNTTIEIRKNNEILQTIPSSENTTGEHLVFYFSFDRDDEIMVQSYDQSGKSSEPIIQKVIDDIKPYLLNLQRITDAEARVSILSEPEAKIEIKKNDVIVAEGLANEKGIFDYTFNVKPTGEYNLYATDYAGNQTKVILQVVDVTVPEKPVISGPIYKESTIVSGRTEPGAKVEWLKNDQLYKTIFADQGGNFSWNQFELNEGDSIQFYSIDSGGNKSTYTSQTVTSSPVPNAPEVEMLTNEMVKITGKADPYSKVVCYKAEEKVAEGEVNGNGSFELNILKQTEGTELTLKSTYLGKTSLPTVIIVKDVIAPLIKEFHEVSDKHTNVTGLTESNAKIEIMVNGTVIGSGTSNNEGYFNIPIPLQKAGTGLEAVAIDSSGNRSIKRHTTILDRTAPLLLKVYAVSDMSTAVTGITEANAIVRVKAKDGINYEAAANERGSFSVSIPKQPAYSVLEVNVRDVSGNISDVRKLSVMDKTAPGAPTVSTVSNLSKTISGKTEPGAKVSIKTSTRILTTVFAGTTGSFKATIPVQRAGTALYITAIDKANNSSRSTRSIVKDVIAPPIPIVNKVTYKSTYVTGKAEPNSLVRVKASASKIWFGCANSLGAFKIKILPRKAGTYLNVTATDASKNESKPNTIIVTR